MRAAITTVAAAAFTLTGVATAYAGALPTPAQAYAAGTQAMLAGNGNVACAALTVRGRTDLVTKARARFGAVSCPQAIRVMAPLVRVLYNGRVPTITNVRVRGTRATLLATAHTAFGASRAQVMLVRVGGRWLIDHDVDL